MDLPPATPSSISSPTASASARPQPGADWRFDNTYARDLAGLSVPWKPATVPEPRWLFLNTALAETLGLNPQTLSGPEGLAMLAGNQVPPGAQPIAQAYAGHQFGSFSPQLGDGRALLLGEVIDRAGQRRDIAFKGSGRTPFSRGGDGKAAVGPMLREALVGEAMQALGIATTRALAVVATGEPVLREQVLPGAVLTRVAASHLRVGTFEFVAARQDLPTLRRLADYAIARHDADLAGAPDRSLRLLERVARRQADLIARWMNVGFIHGVMNTDNMTLSGETIDYGPCAFMEAYDPRAVFSSIDRQGRYAFGNQPAIARWNLARFAEALLPLVAQEDLGFDAAAQDSVDDAVWDAAARRAIERVTAVLEAFAGRYEASLLQGQRAKLGLEAPSTTDPVADADDTRLAGDWLDLLAAQRIDHTLAWRRLCDAAAGDANPLRALCAEVSPIDTWLVRWQARCARDAGVSPEARVQRMRAVNPWIIARNHRVEEALQAASDGGDLGPFNDLMQALREPYTERDDRLRYAQPAPAEMTARYRTFCGT